MDFNLNKFLRAIANTLDTVEIDIFGLPTNHSKRVAYLSIMIARVIELQEEEIFDLSSLAIMHDNGASLKILHDSLKGTAKEKLDIMESRKEHCVIGNDNLKDFPFFTTPINVILYHHEKFDGSGFFGIKGNEIPLYSQIIVLADTLDLTFDLREGTQIKREVEAFIRKHIGTFFSPVVADAFLQASIRAGFWEGFQDLNIDSSLAKSVPLFSNVMSYEEIRELTKTLSRIIDAKSKYTYEHSLNLSAKMAIMADHYHIDSITKYKLLIASDLHDLGKLIISNEILDKPGRLMDIEYDEIMRHPVITRQCLENVSGFEDIAKWAGNHHEKLNGSGYPDGLFSEELDFYSRLLASLDVYQALTEERPYRSRMNHHKAMEVMQEMVDSGGLVPQVVRDVDLVFSRAK
jgi:HD-GYP domain-containing protein (c-di-GMP phosphodiesterase class II)